MRAIYLLFIIYYLLFLITSGAHGATPTPKPGEIGIKAEVKGPVPSSSASATPVSTTSAPKITTQQAGEPAKIQEAEEGIPKTGIQEQTKEAASPIDFITEKLEQADDLLIKDNSWIKLLVLIWLIFIAFIVFLIAGFRKKKKLQLQNKQILGQTPGETAPPGSVTKPSETRDSSS